MSVDLAALADLSHPGEVLRDWIDGHGIIVAETARRLNQPKEAVNQLLLPQIEPISAKDTPDGYL